MLFSLMLAAANLLPNGNFDEGKTQVPAWEKPDDFSSFWVMEKGRGRVLKLDSRMELWQFIDYRKKRDKDPNAKPPVPILAKAPYYSSLGGYDGALFDSDLIPVKRRQDYKLTVSARGKGTPWVWIKGFLWHPREKRYVDAYQTRMHCGPLDEKEWRTFSIGFNPSRRNPRITKMKVRFMVYWPPAVCFFDDVRIEEITPDEMKRLEAERAKRSLFRAAKPLQSNAGTPGRGPRPEAALPGPGPCVLQNWRRVFPA